jgi:hypothetical protein
LKYANPPEIISCTSTSSSTASESAASSCEWSHESARPSVHPRVRWHSRLPSAQRTPPAVARGSAPLSTP